MLPSRPPAADYLVEREARRFVGRARELERIDRLLDGDAGSDAPPLLFLHGPGGIGKSALLREAGRRAALRGLPVHVVEGREASGADAAVRAATEQLRGARVGFLVVDTYEAAPGLGPTLRRELRALLGSGVRVLLAGRRPPERAWREGGWATAMTVVRLGPLSAGESRAFLERRGLVEARAAERVQAWADGSPLALAVATDALLAGHEPDLQQLDADDLLATTLLQHLADDELGGANRDVLAVAALARSVDARLLAAVLPRVNGDHAEAWLRSRSFSEVLGTGVTLHDRVRRAVRASLQATDPGRSAELRRRIADHLCRRGLLGESRLLVDMAELIDDPGMRWMLSPPPVALRTERPRQGDAAHVEPRLLGGDRPLWPGLRRWFDERPGSVVLVRDDEDTVLGFMVVVTLAAVPAWARDDPVVGGWLKDAARQEQTGRVMFLRGSRALEPVGDDAFQASVIGTGNHHVATECELAGVRYVYAAADAEDEQLMAGLEAIGYCRRPALDVPAEVAGRPMACLVHDYGPAGVIGWGRDLVYRSLGIPPPSAGSEPGVDARAVRDVLRGFHDPSVLAASPLAIGVGTAERAASVRARIAQAARVAFGGSKDEQLQAAVLRLGYLDPDGGHAVAMTTLHLSRTAYFRRLAAAAERVAEVVLAGA